MNLLGETFQGFALGHQYFTTQKVQRLNAGGAFVDHADTGITYVLLHTPLRDKPVATEYLHTQVGCFVTDFGQERLGDRGEEAQGFIGRFTIFLGLTAVNDISLLCGQVNQSTGAFCNRFLAQQHATNIRVNDDRISDTLGVLRTTQRAHGQTVFGVGQGALEAKLRSTQTLDRGANTRRVHKGEHAVQAFVLRPDQPAFGAIEIHYASGVAVNTHLVFNGTTGNGIALTGRAVVIRQQLGHDKQGNALGTFRSAWQPGQHNVDDVFGHVMLTSGNENLGAGDAVGAVCIGLSLRTQRAQVGTAMRLGQTHGAGPLAADQLGEVSLLLLFGAVGFNSVGRTVAEAGIHTPGPVRGTHHLAHHQAKGVWQALAAIVGICGHGGPAAFHVLLIRLFEAGWRFHTVFAPGAAFFVAHLVQRRQNLLTELGTFPDDGIDHIRSCIFGAFQIGVVLLAVQQLVHYEFNVTQGRFVVRHGIHLRFSVSAATRSQHSASGFTHTLSKGSRTPIKHLFETYV